MKARDKSGHKITPQSLLNDGAEYCIDQLDGTYQGQLSWSYQKHGAGIFQSLNYDTYIGQWKNNHPNGRGCIIFKSGRLLITHFNRNKPYGLMITRDSQRIVCGTLAADDFKLIGVAFEYEMRTMKWKMVHCKKNMRMMVWPETATVVAEEERELMGGPPRIMTSEPEMFSFVRMFLLDIESLFVFNGQKFMLRNGVKDIFGGLKNGEPNGLAVVMRDNQIEKIGSFMNGKPHGFMYQEKGRNISQGLYFHGLKNGYFQESEINNKNQIMLNEYIQGQFVGGLSQNELSSIKKAQHKKYIERSKNFVSCSNDFTLEKLEHEFNIVPQPIKDDQVKQKPKVFRQVMTPHHHNNIFGQSPRLLTEPTHLNRTYGGNPNRVFEISCLQTVKKKMPYLMRIMNGDEDSIQNEQNPFTS